MEISSPGKSDRDAWHRKGGSPKVIETPADTEELYEAGCFAAHNDPLELRSLRRSGPPRIPQVKAARDAFTNQPSSPGVASYRDTFSTAKRRPFTTSSASAKKSP